MNKKVPIVTFIPYSFAPPIHLLLYIFIPAQSSKFRNRNPTSPPRGGVFLLRRPVFARLQPSPPTGYSSLFHIIRLHLRGNCAPFSFFFFFSSLSTVRASHIALRAREREREKNAWKILPPCGPTTILPLLPSIRAIHTCTCRRIVDKKPVTYPRGWKKNWWKIARGRRDTDSFSFFSLLFISSFFSLLSTGRIYRFPLSLSLSPPTKRTSWRTLGKKRKKNSLGASHCRTFNPLVRSSASMRYRD